MEVLSRARSKRSPVSGMKSEFPPPRRSRSRPTSPSSPLHQGCCAELHYTPMPRLRRSLRIAASRSLVLLVLAAVLLVATKDRFAPRLVPPDLATARSVLWVTAHRAPKLPSARPAQRIDPAHPPLPCSPSRPLSSRTADDESFFFAPAILNLLDPPHNAQGALLCLSIGAFASSSRPPASSALSLTLLPRQATTTASATLGDKSSARRALRSGLRGTAARRWTCRASDLSHARLGSSRLSLTLSSRPQSTSRQPEGVVGDAGGGRGRAALRQGVECRCGASLSPPSARPRERSLTQRTSPDHLVR